ncbi:response regulator [Methylorubrum sp. DB1722]|uniref:response regulator n=1 Tax=Methylorubrum sp. DB1722 TaxID=2478916 RepID=UPI0018E3ABE7|nr:response regulator [Methylorubrum sp. DB1722]MBI1689655.1 response regulator [Methylorubrum sp. DB1722]
MPQTRPLAVVAEDEILLRMETADLLDRLGFEVLEAGTAAAALRYFEQGEDIALLHTDVQMPGGQSGVDLAHEVARRWPSVAVIVCSGTPPREVPPVPERSHFLSKPCIESVVRKALRALDVAHAPLT